MKREVKAYGVSGTLEHDWTPRPVLGSSGLGLSGRGGFGCSCPQQPMAIGVLVCPSGGVGVNLVRARVCPSYLSLPEYFISIIFFNLLLCWLLEEFTEKRQKDVFELRNTSWRSSSWKFTVFCYCLAKNCLYFLSALTLMYWTEACR